MNIQTIDSDLILPPSLPESFRNALQERLPYFQKIYGKENVIKRCEEFALLFSEPKEPQSAKEKREGKAPPATIHDCTPSSLYVAFKQALTLDVSVGKTLGEGWIIAYKNYKTGKVQAQFQIGYKAYVNKLTESGVIVSTVSLSKDELKNLVYNPITEEIKMEDVPFSSKPKTYNENNIEAVVVTLQNDGSSKYNFTKIQRIFTKDELYNRIPLQWDKNQNKFVRKKTSIWNNHYEAMIRKTAIRAMASQTSLVNAVSKLAEAEFNNEIQNDIGYMEVEDEPTINEEKQQKITGLLSNLKLDKQENFLSLFNIETINELKEKQYIKALNILQNKQNDTTNTQDVPRGTQLGGLV